VTVASAPTSGGDSSSRMPMFRSLFQADERSQPVSSAVRELWGNSGSLTSVANAAPPPNGGVPRPLDLFSDRSGTFSG
jgi:hypothetical protein